MKKTALSLLSLLLCCALLAGCGGSRGGVPAGELALDDNALRSDFVCADNNRVFYEIFVGSFSDSNGDGVGDLRGIIRRMDYLNDGDPNSGRSLGVEGIWLTPIFSSPSYHKYDAADYYTIDPAFGTEDDLRELCALCHERNVKLILDLAINHTSDQNPWFLSFVEAHRSGDTQSPFYDFYSWCAGQEKVPAGRAFAPIEGTNDLYECNFFSGMPELNFDNPAVREETLKAAEYWLDCGVDGFRFDAVKYVYYGDHAQSAAFWQWYCDALRARRSEIYLIGEVWDADVVIEEYSGALDCFSFPLSQAEGMIARAAAGGGMKNYFPYVENYLNTVRALRPDAVIAPFIANHDMDRAAGFLPVSNGRMQMAANLYLLGPGSPFLYYGEELGVKGSRGSANTDANRRLAMPWGDGDKVRDPEGADYPESSRLQSSAAEQSADPNSLYTYYKTLLMIRHANPEIARGDYRALETGSGKLGGFVSVWEGRAVCVLHNAAAEPQSFDLSSIGEYDFSQLAAAIGKGGARLEGGVLTLDALTSAVLRAG